MASNLQPTSNGLQPKSDGLHPPSDGLHPKGDDLHGLFDYPYVWLPSMPLCDAIYIVITRSLQ